MIQSFTNLLRHNHSLFKITSIINRNKGGKGGRGRGRKEGVKSEDGEGNQKETPKEKRST